MPIGQYGELRVAAAQPVHSPDPEELARAYPYQLLARLLAAAPDQDLLASLGQLAGDDTAFGRALSDLAQAARQTGSQDCRREYQDLFIGVGRGELVPFGSFYLTGFLHEKPLAKLRGDLRLFGIAREEGVHEPEDHIAALCEVMAGLITGELAEVDLREQKRFFEQHIGSWAGRFFDDLANAKSAGFYRTVGRIGSQLVAIEAEGFGYLDK